MTLMETLSEFWKIRAWSGCDTTSSIMNEGKPSFFKLVQKSPLLKTTSEVMTDYWAESDDVSETAINTFLCHYGGTPDSSLTKMRLEKPLLIFT